MGLLSKIQKLEGRVPWGIIGFLLGVIGIVVGIYYGVRHPVARLVLDVSNEVNVLDVRQPVRDLNIAFRGDDIQKLNLNLRVFTARLENVGDVDILQSHYHRDDTWGIRVANGKLIEVRLVDTNSVYIRDQLNAHIVAENLVALAKVILERGKHFTLELLVLHPKEATPTLAVVGKVAGIDEVPVRKSWSERTEGSVWHQSWAGRSKVQIVRVVLYGGALLIGMIGLAGIAAYIDTKLSAISRNRRQRAIRDSVADLKLDAKMTEALTDAYASGGISGLQGLRLMFDDTEELLGAVKIHQELAEHRRAMDHAFDQPKAKETRQSRIAKAAAQGAALTLIEAGMIKREGDADVSVAAGLSTAIDDLIARAVARGQR